MACTVEDCDRILALCRSKQLKCAVTFTHRARVGSMKAKELLDSGVLGRVLHIRSYQVVPDGVRVVPGWQLERQNLGFLFGHGIHNLDALALVQRLRDYQRLRQMPKSDPRDAS